MRQVNPNRELGTLLVLALTAILLALALFIPGCGEARPSDGTPPTPAFWIKLSGNVRTHGPYTYTTQEPITLADGSQVVCMATLEAIWCKEANE